MIQLSRAAIRKLATNDTVYARGLRYYNEKAILNLTWSKQKKEYHALVKGKSDYGVTVSVKDDRSFTYHCNCPASVKYEGACKHVVAVLLFLYEYMKKSETIVPTDPEEKRIYQILEYFDKTEVFDTCGEIFHLVPVITIPSMIKDNNSKISVSLLAGNERLYKIQSIKKFLIDMSQKNPITLGKEFRFLHGESQFDKASQKILDYFLEIFEIQEAVGRGYYSNLFAKAQLNLTKNMLLKLLNQMSGTVFELNLYDKHFEEVTFAKESPKIKYELSLAEESIQIDYNGKNKIIPVTENGDLLFLDYVLYQPDFKFIRNYIPFYNNLGKNKAPMVFKGENKTKFLERVLPKIYETMELDIPEDMKANYIACDLRTEVYLDRYKNYLKAEVFFCYGEHSFSPLEPESIDNLIIVRQTKKEALIFDLLEQLYFEPHKKFYIMKDEKSIYEFLSERVNELTELCELYYSDEFKKLKITKPDKLHTSIRIASDIDLLQLEFDYKDIPADELKEVLNSLRLKKKYYRLKNGDFINLNNKAMDEITALFEHLNLSGREIKDGQINLPKSAAPYLDSYFDNQQEIIVKRNQEFEKLIETISQPSMTDFELPKGIKAKLRPYQFTGYKWLRTLAANHLGGILADDMGLGKTLQAIVYMVSFPMCEVHKPHLIISPSSLVYNWQDEMERFAPALKTAVVTGTPKERQDIISMYNELDVLVTSYPLIRRDFKEYETIEFHTMFIDEAQFIKNPNSMNAKSVKRIKAQHKFALTGTPIENSLSELWSIFDYIMPYYLFSHTKFVNQYEKPILKEDSKALEDLSMHINPFILRRMKRDVLAELPEKVETKMVTDLTENQRKLYATFLMQIKSELGEEIKKNGGEKKQMQILAALTRLRQICCHPATFLENYKGGSGKLDFLLELLPRAIAGNHRILIFSQFTSMLEIIAKELRQAEYEYFYLEGSTPIAMRNEYVKRFNEGERSVFLISLKAGGTGLNLTGADTVIHFDPWWNPAVEEQATDRAYRIGQKNSVNVLKLITKGTIEEKIYQLQERKKELSDSVIQSKEVFINKLSKEELEDIFELA